MTRFEEKLKNREIEKEDMKRTDAEALEYMDAKFENEGVDIKAAARNMFGIDQDENKLVKNYNKNQAEALMNEHRSTLEKINEALANGGVFDAGLTFDSIDD